MRIQIVEQDALRRRDRQGIVLVGLVGVGVDLWRGAARQGLKGIASATGNERVAAASADDRVGAAAVLQRIVAIAERVKAQPERG